MSDLFISYARKDSSQALELANRLRTLGIDVWIDQHGIEAASSWSKEIVHAIDECKAFIVLLSESSLTSRNVTRELGIASEAEKPLLPVALEDIRLSDEFRYHLSGIQRVAYSQFDAIAQALKGFGIAARGLPNERAAVARKSLIVLPFEDLSPTQDNGWFADGLMSEMIQQLSRIKSLRLIDQKTSLALKHSKVSTAEIAQTLEARYFIQGSVRKFGEQIKIDVHLLDFETGDYLWQESYKGVFSGIFEIQEVIADKVVSALKLHLGSEELQRVKAKRTVSTEAYEYFLRAGRDFSLATHSGLERAIQLLREAISLDPDFVNAYLSLATANLEYYRIYGREPARLAAAEEAIAQIHRIEGESPEWCAKMSMLERAKRDYGAAEAFARRAIDTDPDYAAAYEGLGFALLSLKRPAEAAEAQLEYVRRRPSTSGYFNLLITLGELKDPERLARIAREALPAFQKHLRLEPDDTNAAIQHANVLRYAGMKEEAKSHAEQLVELRTIDGQALYNLACLFASLNEPDTALDILRRAIHRGFSAIETLYRDPDMDPVRSFEEFKEIVKELERKIAEQEGGSMTVT